MACWYMTGVMCRRKASQGPEKISTCTSPNSPTLAHTPAAPGALAWGKQGTPV